MSQPTITPTAGTGDQTGQVSALVARSLAEFTGRGPVRIHTLAGANDFHVVLQDILTKAEANLVAAGESEQVLRTRSSIQDALRPILVAGVRSISGREVVAFLSSNHIDPDISVESFILGEPIAS